MSEKFTGFANAVSPKGKTVDARKVGAYEDDSDAGRIRQASQTTPSSIVDFKTDDKSTNGAPMAVVPAPAEADVEDADAAEGKGANES